MADDRPLFDDEDLPEWLKKGGITYAGKPAAKPPSQAGANALPSMPSSSAFDAPFSAAPVTSGETGALPWVNDPVAPEPPAVGTSDFDFPDWMNAPEDVAPPASTPTASADELPPWMQESPISPSVSAATSGVDFDDLPMPDFDNLGWLAADEASTVQTPDPSSTAGSPATGMTASLPWRQGASEATNEVPASTDSSDSAMSWFNEEPSASSFEPTPAPPAIPYESAPPVPREESQAPRGLKSLLNKPLIEPLRPSAESDPNLTFEQWAQTESAESSLPFDAEDVTAAPEHDWLSAVTESSTDAAPDWLSADPSAAPALDFEAMFGENAPPLPDSGSFDSMDSASDLPLESDLLPDWLNVPPPPSQPPSSGTRVLSDLIPDMGEVASSPPPAEIPDWLQQMTSPPASTPIESATAANVDDWLRDFTSEPPADSQPPASDSSVPDLAEIPEWMRDMAPAAPTPMAEQLQGVDWLDDLPAIPATPQATAEPGALPDWLSAVQPGTVPPASLKPAARQSDQSSRETPELDLSRPFASSEIDRLMNMPISAPRAETPGNSLVDESPASLDFDLDALLGPMPDASAPVPETTSDTSLSRPTFPMARPMAVEPSGPLRKIPQPKPKPAEAGPPSGALSTPDLPDFVADLRPTEAPVPLSVGPIRVGVQEAPLAQLTDQLRQLRERAREFKPPEPTQVSTTGPLAEIKDTLAVEPIIVQAASQPATVATVIAGDLQARRVKIIQNLLELEDDQPGGETVKAKAPARVRPKVDRLLITVVLLMALIAPFMTDAINLMGAPGTSSPTAAQAAVFSAMDGIPAGQPVLMAFEFGPTGSGELDDLSRVLLRDLFRKGAKPVIVSTNPSGALHAEALLSTFGRNATELIALNRIDKPLLARTDYVILRYLPAGAAGVRSVVNAVYFGGFEAQSSFLTDIEGQPSGLSDTDVKRLQGAPAIVLAETADDVRNWAEQFHAPAILSNVAQPKIILAAAAAADATAHTYSASLPALIIGPLVGLRDATVYRTQRQPPANVTDAKTLDQRWQSTGLGALVAGLIIFLGMILNLIQALRRRGSGEVQRARR